MYYGTLSLWFPSKENLEQQEYHIQLINLEAGLLTGQLFTKNGRIPLVGRRQLDDSQMTLLFSDVPQGRPNTLYALESSTKTDNPNGLDGEFHGFYMPAEHRLIRSARSMFAMNYTNI